MQIASWLLATSTLVAPQAQQPADTAATTPAPAVVVAADAPQQRAPQAPSTRSAYSHRLGLGGSLAVSNYGVSGSTRYWFSRHVGLSAVTSWTRPRGYSQYSSGTGSSTLTVAPSLMVTFNETDPNRVVALRPYVGLGVGYTRASGARITNSLSGTYGGTTQQAFGGAEMFFRDYPNLSISAEGVYYNMPNRFVNRYYTDGMNFQVSAHFYLK